MKEKTKQPWPTKDVMNQIYDLKLWGGEAFDFYSGNGSHNPKIVAPYLESVISLLQFHQNSLTVCDLGCGDFNIGKHFTPYCTQYIAVDIVKSLIERNKTRFKEDNLTFKCLDIVETKLPKADCIILRQVLQHLSNSEIKKIIKKLNSYKYIILTEHLPVGDFIPNKNIIAGQGIRLKHNSGVDLTAPPFNLIFKEEKTLQTYHLEHNKGRIVTKLYQPF